ncbi:MAG: ATP-binding cassette domain-containing protein [Propionibacteriales bacterium]|nr:ATP-binding cassette domain-containing protein [Propionibacteriales bacterium]
MTVSISAEHLQVRYGTFTAVDDVSLTVEPGQFVSLLGPSGSGKTSVLRAIAGYVIPDQGRILVGSQDVTRLSPRFRNFGMVFQHYALFPNMRVRDNVAFGLRTRSISRAQVRPLVDDALELVGLADYARRYPEQLSGGQQQRVALARAVVIRPTLLLMDEPLGALDLRMRQQLQTEIRRLQRELGISTVYVTHDQEEAFSMSDEVIVMSTARISASGSPGDLIYHPASQFAANFVGNNTVLVAERAALDSTAVVHGLPGQTSPFRPALPLASDTERLLVVLRAEQLRCHRDPTPGGAAGVVTGKRFAGLEQLVGIRIEDQTVTAIDRGMGLEEGENVFVTWDPEGVHLIEETADGAPVPRESRQRAVRQDLAGAAATAAGGESG